MDSLKTLMEKNQYDLVIKLTENSNDTLSLFNRIVAFIAVGKNDEALNVIKDKRDILKTRLDLLVKFHIEILCLLGRFDEAYSELSYYEEMPYESQEVEEILHTMKTYIRNAEKNSYGPKPIDEEQLNRRLLSGDEEDVLAALDEIKSLPLEGFLQNILILIRRHKRQVIRTFGLLLLLSANYHEEVEFLKGDQLIKVTPALLPEPFVVPGFKDLNAISFAMQKEYRDPTVMQNALQLLSSYLLYIYPDPLKLKKNETIVIFGYLAKKLLQINTDDLEEVCKQKGLDYSKIAKLIIDIEAELNEF